MTETELRPHERRARHGRDGGHGRRRGRLAVVAATALAVSGAAAAAQQTTRAVAEPPAQPPIIAPGPTADLRGRTVEDVRILGNTQVSTAIIRNLIRTRPGEPFDPATVEEDYRRVYGLRKFANVEARVEPTATGVVVVFEVTEQNQINAIRFKGNQRISTEDLLQVVDLKAGEATDRFRISLAREAIESLYKEKNYPLAHVSVSSDDLVRRGDVVFEIVEGPNVRIRNIDFVGARSFTEERLKGQIRTRPWFIIFRAGTLDLEQLDDDVASLRRYYQSKGFFDVRVGRRLVVSPDMTEVQVEFLIDEGPQYTVDRVLFRGNEAVPEQQLRDGLRLVEGVPYDNELVQRDVRDMVRDYSPFGYIFQPQSDDPDYLRIRDRVVYRKEPGKVDLVYEIAEGKPFRLGRIIVKGNARTQDKVVLREMRMEPGQKYDSAAVQDATERLRGTPYFQGVQMTPIGADPESRDLLVEVLEARTASFNVGAGVNSNGGVGGNITYEQRNFDWTNTPDSFGEIFTDRAFTGAGQNLRISLEPGTQNTNASVRFTEPYLFDLPYSFTGEAYYRDRDRRDYDDTRGGGRVTFGKRFDYVYSTALTLRGEDVEIHDIDDPSIRAPEILELEGHSTITSAGLQFRRDTTNRGILPYRGSTAQVGWETFGALGGEFYFQKISTSWDAFFTLGEDLLDRKTILSLHADAGYIYNDAPFFERFYAGGIGSVRGFRFRGISPRSGGPEDDEDPIGGDFSLIGSAEVSFPLAGETLRGVVFADAGTVEEELEINDVRTSVGAGIRLVLPVLGQAPIAVDFAVPITKTDEDETQLISFSFGFIQ